MRRLAQVGLVTLVALIACASTPRRDLDSPVPRPGESPCDVLARRVVQGGHAEWLGLWTAFCAPPSIWGPRGPVTAPQRTDSLRWAD